MTQLGISNSVIASSPSYIPTGKLLVLCFAFKLLATKNFHRSENFAIAEGLYIHAYYATILCMYSIHVVCFASSSEYLYNRLL